MSFIQAIDAEIADLERKLLAVRSARTAYLHAEAEGATLPAPAAARVAAAPPPPKAPSPPKAPKKAAPARPAKASAAKASPVKTSVAKVGAAQASPAQAKPASPSPAQSRTAKATAARRSPQKAKLLEAARDYIELRGIPVPTVDMLKHLKEKGFKIGGAQPRNNLASTLSSSSQFVANGRLGWTVKGGAAPAVAEAVTAPSAEPVDSAPAAAEPAPTAGKAPARRRDKSWRRVGNGALNKGS